MSDLFAFLRERGDSVGSSSRKKELADLGQLVTECKLPVDPDGVIEDRTDVIYCTLQDHSFTVFTQS
jgi:hypothetical protein